MCVFACIPTIHCWTRCMIWKVNKSYASLWMWKAMRPRKIMLKTRNTSIQTETDDIVLDHRLDASLGTFLVVFSSKFGPMLETFIKQRDSHSSLILGEAHSGFIGDDNRNMNKALRIPMKDKLIMYKWLFRQGERDWRLVKTTWLGWQKSRAVILLRSCLKLWV